MIAEQFLQAVQKNLPFSPTTQQEEALKLISDFLFSPNSDEVFLLKGYAGTGKSSLLGALVATMVQLRQKSVLLAPTGRAAKVFGNYAGQSAFTIHKKIYRQQRYNGEQDGFSVTDNLHKDTLFVVDEASMISNSGLDSSAFGTGRLLDDLIHYVYSGENCRLLLIGDTAQLPPVGQEESPALQKEVLASYGLDVTEHTLNQVVRQSESSGILYNATHLRTLLHQGDIARYPKLQLSNFKDVISITSAELVDELSSAYARDGREETIVISRSNKRANAYNQGIRTQVLWHEDELNGGDLVQIVKNNYLPDKKSEGIDFLANGEIVEILRVRRTRELYGFRFCDALVRHLDYDVELELTILLDALHSETSALSREKQEQLFLNVMEDYQHISTKAERFRKLKNDPYYNALQVKYGYATTCHKAQGGEWRNVFLDLGYVAQEHLGENFYRWLYTAFTRATHRLYLVNLPDEFVAG